MHEVEDGKLTLTTGVVLRIGDVPAWAFQEIQKQMRLERPKVPVVHIEAKDRDEPNPNDPDYVDAIAAYDAKHTEKLMDMAIMLGTEMESVPDGFPKPDDEGWTEKLKKLGIAIPDNKDLDARYLSWVKLCAARTDKDLGSLILACGRNAGVTEEDAAEAAASFSS